jgi:hypothetical protein
MYGSQHTAYHIQTGFVPNYVYPSGVRSYPDLESIPSIGSPEPSPPTRRVAMNPLPEPPRQSTYRPPPPIEIETSMDSENWAKYAGLAVAAVSH